VECGWREKVQKITEGNEGNEDFIFVAAVLHDCQAHGDFAK
jgi:hypothetical protein